MSAIIRLMRFGKKGYPTYRIVVLDKRKKRDGAYIEKVGFYNPMTSPITINIVKDKFESWVLKGAQISEGVRKLLKNKISDKKLTVKKG